MKTLFATLAALLSLSSWGQVLLDQNFVSETSSTNLPTGWTERQYNGENKPRFALGANGAIVNQPWKQNALDAEVTIDSARAISIDVVTYATTSNQNTIIYLSGSDYSFYIGNSYSDNVDVYIGELSEAIPEKLVSFQSGDSREVLEKKATLTGLDVSRGLTYHLVLSGASLTGTVSDGSNSAAVSYTLPSTWSFTKVGLQLDGDTGTVGVKNVKVERTPATIYWKNGNSGDWLGEASSGTHTFYDEHGATITYLKGDTVVITNQVQLYAKTAAQGAKFQIGNATDATTVYFTRSGSDCNDYVLSNSTVTVTGGSMLIFQRYDISNNWDSYQNEHPDQTSVTCTTITGAGTVCVNANVKIVLSDATTISTPIKLASGATMVVPSGCTVTTPTTDVEGYKVVSTEDAGTITYSLAESKTVELVIPTIEHATIKSVMTNNAEVVKTDDAYIVEEGATVVVTYAPEAGYALETTTATLKDVSETNFTVETTDIVPVELPYHWYTFNGNNDSSGAQALEMGGNAPTEYVAGAKDEADTAFELAKARVWGNNSGFSLGSEDWTLSLVNTMPTKSNAVVFAAGSASWDEKKTIAIVSLGSEHPGVKVITGSGSTFTELLSAEVSSATTKFHHYALVCDHPTQNATEYALYVDGQLTTSITSSDDVAVGDEYQFGDIHGIANTITTYQAEDGIVDDSRVYHKALSSSDIDAIRAEYITIKPSTDTTVYVTNAAFTSFVDADGNAVTLGEGDTISMDKYTGGQWNCSPSASVSGHKILWMSGQSNLKNIPDNVEIELPSGAVAFVHATSIGAGTKITGEGRLDFSHGYASDYTVGDGVEISCATFTGGTVTMTVKGAASLTATSVTMAGAIVLAADARLTTTADLSALSISTAEGYRVVKATESGTTTYATAVIHYDENGIEPYHWYKFDGDSTSYGEVEMIPSSGVGNTDYAFTDGAVEDDQAAENIHLWADSGLSLGTNNAWTIMLVGKLSDTTNGVMFSVGSSDHGGMKGIYFKSTGEGIEVASFGGTYSFSLAAEVENGVSTYHQFALSYTNKTYTLFVDGVEKAETNNNSFVTIDTYYQFGAIHGGKAIADTTSATNNDVDDFRVYHAALTADQLKLAAVTFGLATRYELAANEDSHMTSRKLVKTYLTAEQAAANLVIANGTAKSTEPTTEDPVGTYYRGTDDEGTYLLFVAKELAPHTFEIGTDGNFKLDGTNFLIRCAEMHFARMPRDYWRLRIRQAKACGFNAVCAYMFWNNHEPEKDHWRFDGEQDVHYFCELAKEEGMWVVLRPGPYTCAEWEYGGFPWWFRKESVGVRSMDEKYLAYSQTYLNKVAEVIADMQITRGGNILMVQVENEYGFYGNNTTYMRACYNATVNAGFEVPKFCCAPNSVIKRSGYIPELFPVVNGSGGFFDAGGGFQSLRELRAGTQWANAPLMVGEYYPAWYDKWGSAHNTKSTAACVADLEAFCSSNASFSVYMAHGGTSFGWWAGYNGANDQLTTSYDYEAPITEAGHYNEKFWAFKAVFDKHLNAFETQWPSNSVPEEIPVQSATVTSDPEYASLWKLTEGQFTRVTNNTSVLNFENLDLGYGYAIYETTIPAGVSGLLTGTIKDLGVVRVDGVDVGFIDRIHTRNVTIEASESPRTLQIFAEGMGRSHFYLDRDVNNGIVSDIKVGDTTLTGWTMKTFDLIEYKTAMSNVVYAADTEKTARSASLYKYTVTELEYGKDTFLDMRDWKKGMVCLNGRWLGRYWSIGPQQTLYVPGCWLDKSGTNEVIVLDVTGADLPAALKFVDTPTIDELRPGTDYYRSRSMTLTEGSYTDSAFTDVKHITVAGGTIADPVVVTDTGSGLNGAQIMILSNCVLKVVANGNKTYLITGQGPSSTLIVSGTAAWGVNAGTQLRNLTLIVDDSAHKFWIEYRTPPAFNETVDVVLTNNSQVVIGGGSVTLCSLTGEGSLSPSGGGTLVLMGEKGEEISSTVPTTVNNIMTGGDLDPAKSWTSSSGEEIPVTPTLSDATDETPPLAVEDGEVALGVKTIPGLTYHLDRYGSVSAANASMDATTVDYKTAEGTRTQLKDEDTDKPASAFYKVRVTK